jgi:hypothetical protein
MGRRSFGKHVGISRTPKNWKQGKLFGIDSEAAKGAFHTHTCPTCERVYEHGTFKGCQCAGLAEFECVHCNLERHRTKVPY